MQQGLNVVNAVVSFLIFSSELKHSLPLLLGAMTVDDLT
jgi:hypothetical protein